MKYITHYCIFQLTVVDQDHSLNGEIQFTVNNNKFTVDKNMLVTTQVLDRETQSHYDLTITVTDKGTPPKVKARYNKYRYLVPSPTCVP